MSETKKKRPWVKDAAIYSALRRVYRTSPAVKAVLDAAKSEYFVPSKHGKPLRRVQFECAKCHNKYPKGKPRKPNVQVDHIDPVVDPSDGNKLANGTKDWNKQIDRLIVEKNMLQVLCRACHTDKSKAENKIRRENRKVQK